MHAETIELLKHKGKVPNGAGPRLEAKLDLKFERWTTRMIIAMILSQTATSPIRLHLFESPKQVTATFGH